MRALWVAVVVAVALVVGPVAPAADAPAVFRVTVKSGRPVGGIARPTVRRGTVVRVVVSDRGEAVHLHGTAVEGRFGASRKVTLQFVARVAGRFELELHHPDVLLLRLTVTP